MLSTISEASSSVLPYVPIFSPTPYKVSTITATGSVNTGVCLDSLFEHIQVIDDDDTDNGIVYLEYGSRKTETIHKGHAKKLSVSRRTTNPKKRFDNQVTVVYRFKKDDNTETKVNSKIFRNGNIQMTGLRYIEQGSEVVDRIIDKIRQVAVIDDGAVKDSREMRNENYRIRLINCDFRVGFEIKRDKLYKLVLAEYKVTCSYEPCIYPGVKIQYWYNDENTVRDGCCYCKDKCGGKGCGSGNGNCKKITISVFQSGCIIITGGQSIPQIDEAYAFICGCVDTHKGTIVKIDTPLPAMEAKRKKVYIKKSSIKHNKGIVSTV